MDSNSVRAGRRRVPRIFAGLIFKSRSSSCSLNPFARSTFAQLASASGCQLEPSCPVSLDKKLCSGPTSRIVSTYLLTTAGCAPGLPNCDVNSA